MPAPTYPPAIPEWTRSYDDERREGVGAMRGLLCGLLLSLPPAGLLIAGITWLVSALG
ncbi:MAG: hypothetical protein QM611_10015 [Microbacterium sp.]|uniref:hypothetical protein n=1 Tax=Microbacterium sp. TaxID=51671 RepID=UPI0039E5D874